MQPLHIYPLIYPHLVCYKLPIWGENRSKTRGEALRIIVKLSNSSLNISKLHYLIKTIVESKGFMKITIK
jgi:hypothetical protein